MNIEQAQQHALASLNATELTRSDFNYLMIHDLFPEDFYQQLKQLPVEETDEIVHSVFNHEPFVQALAHKFEDSPRRSDTIRSVYAFWQRAGAGYTLKPHVDSYPRVFTMTVYLADDNDTPEAGTAAYRVDRSTRTWETIGMMEYLRNSCMIISPYDDLTWHGVNLIEKDIVRDSVVLVYSAEEWNESQMHYANWKPGETVNYVLPQQ